MKRTNFRAIALGLGITIVAAGCESATGTRGETRVQLSRSAAPAAALLAEDLLLSVAATGNVPVADVQSVEVTITRVEALPRNEDEDAEAAWVSLDVTADSRVNLLALPTATEGGINIARGELAPGTYGNLRLFVENATVTFAKTVQFGGGVAARTYAAGTAYPLRIPSSEQAGIRVPSVTFTVAEDAGAEVTVLFESGASVQSIQTTGIGLQMSPVLTARNR